MKPTVVMITMLIAALAVLPRGRGERSMSMAAAAKEFATLQHQRCMNAQPQPEPLICALRTVQLAAALHGQPFADMVAEQIP